MGYGEACMGIVSPYRKIAVEELNRNRHVAKTCSPFVHTTSRLSVLVGWSKAKFVTVELVETQVV